jgi:hypothetical protein
MALFRTSTEDALKNARGALTGANAKIVELDAERALKLEQQDIPVAEIQRIDTALAAHRHAILICEARITGLLARQHQERRAELERQKKVAIERIGKDLGRRGAAAARMVAALVEIKAAYVQLMDADRDAFAGWPAVVHPAYDLSFLMARANPELGRGRNVGSIQAIVDGRADGLTEDLEKKAALLIEALNEATIPDVKSDDETDRAAA